ncbi:MAG: hypothetical protein KME09_04265 [Pleurocapsa minor HA4230-MV1]|jgi:low affinity Fe/Cu permease|nr:hypothetical protein [Pleurocapsa minor HA4230-MV1]
MNINKHGINCLSKLALIISIFLNIANSVSAQDSTLSPLPTTENTTLPSSTNSNISNPTPSLDTPEEQKPDISEQLTQIQKDLNDSGLKEINQSLNNKDFFSKKNSLIFIDLPILAILLLLWFLTQNKQQKQIKELTKNQNKIISKFNQLSELDNQLSNLDRTSRQIIEKIQDSNQRNIDSEIRLRELFSKQQFNQSVNYHNSLTSDISHLNSIVVVDKVSQFVETYNQNKNSICDNAKTLVAERQVSLNQRRSGSANVVTLENTTQKKYCIIEEENNYYLIPHTKIKFDEFNKSTLESLFDCANLTSDYHNFQLVKPAKVSQIDSEIWQLEEKGKLNFY